MCSSVNSTLNRAWCFLSSYNKTELDLFNLHGPRPAAPGPSPEAGATKGRITLPRDGGSRASIRGRFSGDIERDGGLK